MSTFAQSVPSMDSSLPSSTTYKLRRLLPAVAAIFYPFLLDVFHRVVSPPAAPMSIVRTLGAAFFLLAAMAMPLVGLVSAFRTSSTAPSSSFELRARRLAYISIGMPPFFVLLGVSLGLLHLHVSDELAWVVVWLGAAVYVLLAPEREIKLATQPLSKLRVAHGAVAALVVFFVLFHLTNHLFGLAGPDVHAAIMKVGRLVYRSHVVEPILISLMLFQVISGAQLALRWSSLPADAYRVFQIGSGAYLEAFILTHLNSALISARTVHKIDTNWAWASGAPAGLIHNAWNIRLVPHYAFGVFFILSHLASGLRGVVIAHGMNATIANRVWAIGLTVSALISIAIMSGLCGVRI